MLKNKKQQKKKQLNKIKEFKSTKERNDYFLRESVSGGKREREVRRFYKVFWSIANFTYDRHEMTI